MCDMMFSIFSKFQRASLGGLLNEQYSWVKAKFPLTMEQLGYYYGFALYKTTLSLQGKATLNVPGVRDRAVVYCDKVRVFNLLRKKSRIVMCVYNRVICNDNIKCKGFAMSGLSVNILVNFYRMIPFGIKPGLVAARISEHVSFMAWGLSSKR